MSTITTIGMGFFTVAGLMMSVSSLWILVLAFMKHWGWGLASLLLPGAYLIYAIVDWRRAQMPLVIHIFGFLLLMIVIFVYGPTMLTELQTAP